MLDRCITNRNNYPGLKEIAVLVKAEPVVKPGLGVVAEDGMVAADGVVALVDGPGPRGGKRNKRPDAQRLQKLFPRCYARGIAFIFEEWLVSDRRYYPPCHITTPSSSLSPCRLFAS